MEWESEENVVFLKNSCRNTNNRISLWDEYSLFNARSEELRTARISKNQYFAERSKERLVRLEKAEKDGLLVMKSED